MASIIETLMDDLKAELQLIADVSDSIQAVYDHYDLTDAKMTLSYPCLGILYIGMFPNPDGTKTGSSVKVAFELLLIGGERAADYHSDGDVQLKTLQTLDDIRLKFFDKRSSRSHKWEFAGEFPREIPQVGDDEEPVLAYAQRWQTTVIWGKYV